MEEALSKGKDSASYHTNLGLYHNACNIHTS